jgi:hypothetical protein
MTMASNQIPASELPPGASVRADNLTEEGRAELHRFLSDHSRHYSGHPTELERWVRQTVLDQFSDTINAGQPIEFTLTADAAKYGSKHVFRASPNDVLCEMIVIPQTD